MVKETTFEYPDCRKSLSNQIIQPLLLISLKAIAFNSLTEIVLYFLGFNHSCKKEKCASFIGICLPEMDLMS